MEVEEENKSGERRGRMGEKLRKRKTIKIKKWGKTYTETEAEANK